VEEVKRVNRHEIIVILDPALTEDGVEAEISGLREIAAKKGGEVLEVQKWGKKRLAYEVKKRRDGQYVLMKTSGISAAVVDFERHFRITESILKGMVVRTEESRGKRFKEKSQAMLAGSSTTSTQEVEESEF
jgi:small subunit ribosomal protein S6